VKQIVPAALGHRIILHPESRLQNVTVSEILTDVLDQTKAPVLESPTK
jgi:hypothetical protein